MGWYTRKPAESGSLVCRAGESEQRCCSTESSRGTGGVGRSGASLSYREAELVEHRETVQITKVPLSGQKSAITLLLPCFTQCPGVFMNETPRLFGVPGLSEPSIPVEAGQVSQAVCFCLFFETFLPFPPLAPGLGMAKEPSALLWWPTQGS